MMRKMMLKLRNSFSVNIKSRLPSIKCGLKIKLRKTVKSFGKTSETLRGKFLSNNGLLRSI